MMRRRKSNWHCLGVIAVLAVTTSGHTQPGGFDGPPFTPEVLAKFRQMDELSQQAEQHIKGNRPLEAIPLLQNALTIRKSIYTSHGGGFEYQIAKAYEQAQRPNDALAWYQKAFKWNPEKQEVEINGPPLVRAFMDYAILLSEQGRSEDAKSIYYSCLRVINESNKRDLEPVPFLVVFDPEPEGISWEYSLNRFKAAALMAVAIHNGNSDLATSSLSRAKSLAPDWYYPYAVAAAKRHRVNAKFLALVDQADALARPGLEKAFVAQIRIDVAELERRNDEANLSDGPDRRPMTEGNMRRSQMQCLRPNAEVLSRLCTG